MSFFTRVKKYNMNHGADGRFTDGGEGTASQSITNPKAVAAARETHPATAKGFMSGESREQYNSRRMAQAMREGTSMTWDQAQAKEQEQYARELNNQELKIPRIAGMSGKLNFPMVIGGGASPQEGGTYRIQAARYAKGKVLVQAPSTDGWATRASRVAEGVGGKYTNREKGFIMSPKQAERFHQMVRHGRDFNAISGKVV